MAEVNRVEKGVEKKNYVKEDGVPDCSVEGVIYSGEMDSEKKVRERKECTCDVCRVRGRYLQRRPKRVFSIGWNTFCKAAAIEAIVWRRISWFRKGERQGKVDG